MTFFCLKTLAQNVFMCYNKYIMLNKTINKGNTMTKENKSVFPLGKLNKYQIDTILWSKTTSEEGDLFLDENGELYEDNTHEVEQDEQQAITFEVIAEDEKSAWIKGEDYMYTHYNQELYNADTTITKVGA